MTEAAVREPAETVPPEIEEVRRPATETVPPAMPPVMVASLAKEVVPAPVREARVMVPVVPVKPSVPALVTPERERPVPETVAAALPSRESVAAPL